MTDVRTPLCVTEAVALGNKLWKKEILREGKLHYNGGEFDVTPEYLDSVHAAFQDGAIPAVPYVHVNKGGEHDESPERWRGNIVGLERTPLGLAAILDLGDEADELVRKTNKKLGVSVLIKHNRTTGGGKKYPAVLSHVAATFDPVVNDLAEWEEIAASQPGDDVLDLLALTAPRDETPTPPGADPDQKETSTVATTLTDEQAATLDALAALLPTLSAQYGINRPVPDPAAPVPTTVAEAAPVVQPADPTPADQPFVEGTPEPNTDPEPEPDGEPVEDEAEFTDAELDAMAAALSDDLDTPAEPELVAASHGAPTDTDTLQLSHDLRREKQAREALELRLAQVERERDDRAYTLERDRMARELGIAPRLTDIIAPLLRGTGTQIALSNGQSANAGELVRKFVRELSAVGFLDLSLSQGTPVDVDVDTSADEEAARKAAAAAYVAALNG